MKVGVIPSAADRSVLDDRRATRAMSWIMAIMLFLTVIAAAVGLGTVDAAGALDRQLAGRLTVQVVEPDPSKREAAAGAVLAALVREPTVARAARVAPARLDELLKPWLGDSAEDAGAPVPALIDVDMSVPSADSAARVAAAVRQASPSARVDAQARWLTPVAGFLRTLIAAAGALVLLMVAATLAVVLLAARAGLETHRDTIAILHMLGSTDVQVARLFQRRIAFDTLIGGAIGAIAAMAAVWLLGRQLAGMGSELAGGAMLTRGDWLILAALPLAFAAIATIAARVAVLRRLRRTV